MVIYGEGTKATETDEQLNYEYDKFLSDFMNTTYIFDNFEKGSGETLVTGKSIHSPKITAKLLKSFKYDTGNSFKKLVHSPNDPETFNFINTYDEAKIYWNDYEGKIFLHKKLVNRIDKLFNVLGTEGIEFWLSKKKHPIYEDINVTLAIQEFKKAYRFSDEESEGSILSKCIRKIAKETVYSLSFSDKFGDNAITYMPNEERFNIKAVFFADVFSFEIGLKTQLQSMIKHSKSVDRNKLISETKKIPIKIQRDQLNEGYIYHVIICDLGSYTVREPEVLLKELRDQAKSFYSVCDWTVVSKCGEGTFKLILQPFLKESDSIIPIPDSDCQGFTHIFTFYDV